MGTNFYWLDSGKTLDPEDHIGKRHSKGLFCWDCGVPVQRPPSCPCCKNFTCKVYNTFTWTKLAHKWKLQSMDEVTKVVIDEYGKEYTAREFFEDALQLVLFEKVSYQEFS